MNAPDITPANERRVPIKPATAEFARRLDGVLEYAGLIEKRQTK
jgi:hypothetical protein